MVVILAIVAAVPLANYIATSTSRTLFLSRSNDADWFATMAESPLQSGDIANLRELAVRYHELYNTPVFVVDVDRKVVATSRSGVDVKEPDLGRARQHAGRPPARRACGPVPVAHRRDGGGPSGRQQRSRARCRRTAGADREGP